MSRHFTATSKSFIHCGSIAPQMIESSQTSSTWNANHFRTQQVEIGRQPHAAYPQTNQWNSTQGRRHFTSINGPFSHANELTSCKPSTATHSTARSFHDDAKYANWLDQTLKSPPSPRHYSCRSASPATKRINFLREKKNSSPSASTFHFLKVELFQRKKKNDRR